MLAVAGGIVLVILALVLWPISLGVAVGYGAFWLVLLAGAALGGSGAMPGILALSAGIAVGVAVPTIYYYPHLRD